MSDKLGKAKPTPITKVLVSGTDDLSNQVARFLRSLEYPKYEVVRYKALPPEGLDPKDFAGVWISDEVLKLLA